MAIEPHLRRPVARRILELLYYGRGCKACFYQELQAADSGDCANFGLGEKPREESSDGRTRFTVLWPHTCGKEGSETVDRAWVKPLIEAVQVFAEEELEWEAPDANARERWRRQWQED